MKTFLLKMKLPVQRAMIFVVLMTGFYQSYGQEFLLRDETFTWDENEDGGGGYHYWREFCGAPSGNWTSPNDYKNGTFYFRLELLNKPTSNPDRFNMCIWTDFVSSPISWRESCYSLSSNVTSPGVYTWSGGQSSVVGGGIDWTAVTSSRLWHFGLAHFVGNCNLAAKNYTAPECEYLWADRDLYLPMQMRVTIVGVASGHSFSGWSYWLNSGGCDDGGGGGGETTAPTPTFTINYASERTNTVVSSSVEFSYSSNMSGAVSGSGAYLYLTPGQDVYFRTKAGSTYTYPSAIQHLDVPSRLSAPSFGFSYSTEKTSTTVSSEYEYSTQSNMSDATTGSGTTVTVIPGTTMYFRKKATGSAFASSIQSLAIPSRPAAPAFGIDYDNETTDEAISSAYQYSTSSDMGSATTGSGSKLAVTPGTTWYFRQLATASAFQSSIQTLTGPARPSAPAFTIDYASEKTTAAVTSEVEYSSQADMSSAITGSGSVLNIAPGSTTYFRKKATASSYYSNIQTLAAPARPAAPDFTIDYLNGTTGQAVTSAYEYSHNADMSQAETGSGTTLMLASGTTYYFRKLATATDFKSSIQSLAVPVGPAAPSFAIDYLNEATTTPVSAEYEYADNANMSSATTGNGNVVILVPGTTWYFRKKGTATEFPSAIQTLVVPARADGPVYTIDYENTSTVESAPAGHEYSENSDMTGAVAGSGSPVTLDPGSDMYFRIKAASDFFRSFISQLVVPSAPEIQTNAPDTLTASYFLISVDFHKEAADFTASGLEMTNATAELVSMDMFRITPEVAGEVTVKVKANSISGGNFESETVTTYYKTATFVPEIMQGEGSMLVYPSPVHDMLNLETRGNISLPGAAEIVDIRGSVVRSEEIQSAHSTLDISTLPEGLYMLKFVDGHGKVFMHKVIKR